MTRGNVHMLQDRSHVEEQAQTDQSFEERLLLIELTEVQRELHHAKREAEQAHAASDAASALLQARTESMQQEIGKLTAQIIPLEDTLHAECERANEDVQELHMLKSELLSTKPSQSGVKSSPENLERTVLHTRTQGSDTDVVDESESAMWQALHAARNDAALATAQAAEAKALADACQKQLKIACAEKQSLLDAMGSAVGISCDDDMQASSQVAIVAKAKELTAEISSIQGELEAVRARLRDEQAASLQIYEDLLCERRASAAALASVAAKQSQLDQWNSQIIANVASGSSATADHESDAGFLPADANLTEYPSVGEPGSDVAEIVSKWRSMSMKQVSEVKVLADQLVLERKALHNMRGQALMLERQVETVEDQLESERSSAAARETSMRTQITNLEAQLSEQERLLVLKASAVAAAEAQTESTSAELVRANEQVRALEDMVQSAEKELQSAIRQMSDMQTMVMSTDAKLLHAQAGMADRNDALPGLKRLIMALSGLAECDSTALKSWTDQGALTAVQDAEQLMSTVEQVMSANRDAVHTYKMRCTELEHGIGVLKDDAAKAQSDLAVQCSAVLEKQSSLNEMVRETKRLSAKLEQTSNDLESLQLESQQAFRLAEHHAAQAKECEGRLTELQAELDKVAAGSQHACGQLAARSEEVACGRKQLKAADELNVKLKSRLRDLDRELATCRAHAVAAAEAQAASHQEAEAARVKLNDASGRLEESEAHKHSMQVALEKRNQEVRELNSMLKAWEAMRLSKDAQIAALMERCKRYDEDIAEKGRSNEALRRKLMHHHGVGSSRGTSHMQDRHATSQHSMSGSIAGSLNASDSGRTRHIHLHMHGSSGAPSSSSGQPIRSGFNEGSQQRRLPGYQ
eukprot:jgi/Ulvmu1/7226/UM035_0012.1